MLAGRAAGDYVTGRRPPADNIRLLPGDNVAYCVPHTLSTDREHIVYMRVTQADGEVHHPLRRRLDEEG